MQYSFSCSHQLLPITNVEHRAVVTSACNNKTLWKFEKCVNSSRRCEYLEHSINVLVGRIFNVRVQHADNQNIYLFIHSFVEIMLWNMKAMHARWIYYEIINMLWQCYDNVMTMFWQCYDNVMTVLWQCHDNVMTILRTTYFGFDGQLAIMAFEKLVLLCPNSDAIPNRVCIQHQPTNMYKSLVFL